MTLWRVTTRSFAAYSAPDAHAQMTVRSRRNATIAIATPTAVSAARKWLRDRLRTARPVSVMTRAFPCRGGG